jgi:hypothetical protein
MQYLPFVTKLYNYRTAGKLMRERKKGTWWGFEPANLTTPHMNSDQRVIYWRVVFIAVTGYCAEVKLLDGIY